ncbi:MAG: RNA polymerase sigma factor [Candidatus Limnocylindrales bacterium]
MARSRSDAAAFGQLYDFYLPRIHGFIQRRVGERSVAEDLTAATFERALVAVRAKGFRNDAFGGWLYRVAANVVIDHARRDRRLAPLDGMAAGTDLDERAGEALAAALARDELRRAFARLSAPQRRVLTLRFLDDLDPAEASAVLGCSRNTFAVRLRRALQALRDAMAEEATDAA